MATLLTPAEERGLHGLSLDSRVRQAFFAIPPQTIVELVERMISEAFNRKLLYMREGRAEAIRVFLRPTGVMPDQWAYLHFVSLTLINALKRLPDLYIQDFNVWAITPITPVEEKWLWGTWSPSQRDQNPVFGRLDAVLDFTSPTQWVVQQLTRIPVSEFPVVSADGHVHIEPFYTVMGLAPTKYGVSLLGRASQKMVVNVAQRGGMCAALIGQSSWRLRGPGESVQRTA